MIAASVAVLIASGCSAGDTVQSERVIRYPDSTAEYGFFTEEFVYFSPVTPERPDDIVEKTGWRLMIRYSETDETECVCRDPVCAHDIASFCPAASGKMIDVICVVEGTVFFRCGTGTDLEIRYLSLSGGEFGTAADVSADGFTPTYAVEGKYVFFVSQDLTDRKTEYLLNRYELDSGKTETLAVFEKPLYCILLTSCRIYLGENVITSDDPGGADVFSLDYYKGKLSREPDIPKSVSFFSGSMICGPEYVRPDGSAASVFSGRYRVFDLDTREYRSFPEEGYASVAKFSEKSGRIYYVAGEGFGEAFTLNPGSFCYEKGITQDKFGYAEMREYSERINDAMFGHESFLRSCLPDGTGETTHFVYEAGQFIDTPGSNAAPASDVQLAVKVTRRGQDGAQDATFRAVIDLETGELIPAD
ncbi:MAG: hypothetical protein ILO42_03245 [Clostridia bacterium]|nr:hypothetical protein [Clostridia bacterium]